MADTKLPGEVDEGVVSFRDLPGKKEYIIITDVPVLDEHLLTGDGDNQEEWIGPERLQEIATNNNKRIQETGDAAPITIGHTKDGAKETEQPSVVGYATDFKVAPLLNASRMAIYANFHILRDRLDEVKNYPRRSVELWPKRWEIDPIALLGATTPERDLGLLQLDRGGRPIRYRRVLNEDPDMADEMDEGAGEKPPKKAAKKAKAETGSGADDADDTGGELSGESEKIAQRVLALLMESGPIKELMAAAQGQPPGVDPNDPSGQNQPPMGGRDPSGMGQGDPQAAFFHQGAPQRYEEDMDGDGDCDYNDRRQQYSHGYPSASNGYMPSTSTRSSNGHRSRGEVPYDGESFYEDHHEEHPMRRSSTATSRERYERYLAEQEDRRRYAASQQQSPQRRAAAATDAAVGKRREDDEISRMKIQIKKLERDKTEAERTSVLRGLQAEGYVLEVAEEIDDCAEMSDETFSNHVGRIKKRYARDPSGVMPIRMVDSADPPVRRQRSKNQTEEAHYARDIGGYMAAHPGCDFKTAEMAIMAERDGRA